MLAYIAQGYRSKVSLLINKGAFLGISQCFQINHIDWDKTSTDLHKMWSPVQFVHLVGIGHETFIAIDMSIMSLLEHFGSGCAAKRNVRSPMPVAVTGEGQLLSKRVAH
jgi:hypothetical protein